jgi:metal-sulfur cluster biosynthetic enzyme
MSAPDRHTSDKIEAVLAQLGRVSDPELDEPVTDLGFVTGLEIDAQGVVKIGFRLPTYWCAANFAFMMADDMRREVAALPWVTRVEPRLGAHMYADTINQGVAQGLSFAEAFRDTSEGEAVVGDLSKLRQTFLIKAYQRRQEALLQHLHAAGHSAPSLVALCVHALQVLPLDGAGARLRDRYLERRALSGAVSPEALAFVTAEGAALNAAALPEYLRMLGRVNVSAEFNGALCRGLLAARFNEPPREAGQEPDLRHFIHQAAGSMSE